MLSGINPYERDAFSDNESVNMAMDLTLLELIANEMVQ